LAADDTVGRSLSAAQVFAACPEFSADFKISGLGEQLRVKPGTTYRIYIQPTPARPQIGSMQISYTSNIDPQFELEDANTVKATVRGASGGKVNVELSGGRRFSVVVDAFSPER
jgi:hypothetical protein